MPSSSDSMRTCFFGSFSLKERWGLTWRGGMILFVILSLLCGLFITCIVPFLATTNRVDARILVVEGWIHDYAIRSAVEEFKSGSYERIITTGGPVKGSGGYTNDFNTSASVAAERLVAAGVAANLVQMVPSRVGDRERTYSSALALKDWLLLNNLSVKQINIATESIHARRTRLLFQKALGDKVAVGIIAIPEKDYDMRRWWLYSEGMQEVFRESIAYGYARFLFHPEYQPGP